MEAKPCNAVLQLPLGYPFVSLSLPWSIFEPAFPREELVFYVSECSADFAVLGVVSITPVARGQLFEAVTESYWYGDDALRAPVKKLVVTVWW
jgi:hypothetical protein